MTRRHRRVIEPRDDPGMHGDVYDDLGVRVGELDVRRGRRIVPAARLGASWIEHEAISSLPVVIAIGGLAIAVQGSVIALACGVGVFLLSSLWLWWQAERKVLCVDVGGWTWELASCRDETRLYRIQQQIDMIRPDGAPVACEHPDRAIVRTSKADTDVPRRT
jgi:hypothetical protein